MSIILCTSGLIIHCLFIVSLVLVIQGILSTVWASAGIALFSFLLSCIIFHLSRSGYINSIQLYGVLHSVILSLILLMVTTILTSPYQQDGKWQYGPAVKPLSIYTIVIDVFATLFYMYRTYWYGFDNWDEL